MPGGPHGQRRAPGDHQVGVGDQLGGQRGGEAAGDAERPRLGRRTARAPRRRSPAARRSASASASSSAPGVPGAAAGDEHRALGAVEQRRPSVGDRGPAPGRGGRQVGRAGAGAGDRGRGLHVERQVEHDGAALVAAGAVGPDDVGHRRRRRVHPLGDGADGARPAASWSMRKFDRTAAPAVSAASTSSGVRLFAASAMPVIALVSPQPWCTRDAPRPRPTCGRTRRPSSPRRPRGGRRRTGTPAARSALVTWKLPLPTTPNACPTPSSRQQRADRVGDRRRSPLDQREHPRRAARAADDRQRATRPAPRRWRAAGRGCAGWSGPTCRAPSRKWWHGNGGSKPPARARVGARRSPRRTRSAATPAASHRAHSADDPRGVRAVLVGVQERRPASPPRASHPVR